MYIGAPDVIATDLEHELILLDPRNGEMFALNATGRRVWLSLPARSDGELADLLVREFAVEPERARVDVAALLSALTEAGLVEQDVED